MTRFQLALLSHGSRIGDNHTWRRVRLYWAHGNCCDHNKDIGGHIEEENSADVVGSEGHENGKEIGGNFDGDPSHDLNPDRIRVKVHCQVSKSLMAIGLS